MGARGGANRGLAALTCVVFGACSNLPAALPLVPAGEPVSIAFSSDSSAPDINVAATAGGTVGTAGGVIGGGAGIAASLACGFLVVICLPAFAFGGAAAGGLAGTVAGMSTGPQRADLDDLQQRLEAFARENDPRGQFLDVLSAKAKTRWQLIGSAPTRMSVHMTGLGLQAWNEEEVVLAITVQVVVTTPHSEAYLSRYASASSPPTKVGPVAIPGIFNYKGPPASIAQWRDGSGDFLRAAVARAYEDVALQIVVALSNDASRF
jgi:hypothetical protein